MCSPTSTIHKAYGSFFASYTFALMYWFHWNPPGGNWLQPYLQTTLPLLHVLESEADYLLTGTVACGFCIVVVWGGWVGTFVLNFVFYGPRPTWIANSIGLARYGPRCRTQVSINISKMFPPTPRYHPSLCTEQVSIAFSSGCPRDRVSSGVCSLILFSYSLNTI